MAKRKVNKLKRLKKANALKEAAKTTHKLGYSFLEAEAASSLSRRTLEYLIQEQKLSALKIGNRVIIKADSLRELLGVK